MLKRPYELFPIGEEYFQTEDQRLNFLKTMFLKLSLERHKLKDVAFSVFEIFNAANTEVVLLKQQIGF